MQDKRPLLPTETRRPPPRGGPRNFSTIVLAFSLFVLAVSAFSFVLILNKRNADSSARERVRAEQGALDLVTIKLQRAQVLEANILQQKEKAIQLQDSYTYLKEWITINMMNITNIDTLTGLAQDVNGTISNITTILDTQILLLEQAFQDVLSVASHPEITSVVKSGTCTLQGLSSKELDYEYRKVVVSGLDYYYYLFNDTTPDSTINIDNTGFTIESCNPLLYVGPSNNVFAPLILSQLNSFEGTGASEIVEIGAGSNVLRFHTSAFAGTRTLAIKEPLTHFVSFF